MSTSETLKAALDVSLATEQGDIDIADDVLKSAAFLVALSSAAIYYALAQIERTVSSTPERVGTIGVLIGTVTVLAASVLVAVRVHRYHTVFRALCRNMLVAKRLLHSELLEKIADVERVQAASSVPLWALVTSGAISEHIASPAGSSFSATQLAQVEARRKLDVAHGWQRFLVVAGFFILVGATLAPALIRILG